MSRSQIINVRNGQVCFNGISLSNWDDLCTQIEHKHEIIDHLKEDLYMIGIAHPTDIVKDGDVISGIKHRIYDIIDSIQDEQITLQNLYYIKALIEDYKYLDNISIEEAWNKAVVDMYEDLRKELKQNEKSNM